MTSFTEPSGSLGKTDVAERGWLHEEYPNFRLRSVVLNRLMRDDEHGIEISQRPTRASDVICGARTIEPGNDLFAPEEVICTFAGDHGEAPHIGIPIECADMTTPGLCREYGTLHLVIVGFAIRPGERATEQERTTS